MELANKGEIYDYLNTSRTLSEEIVRTLFHQLIEGKIEFFFSPVFVVKNGNFDSNLTG